MSKEGIVRLAGRLLVAIGGVGLYQLYIQHQDWKIIAVGLTLGISGLIYGADND